VTLSPARLEPLFSLRPWGARSLAPLFPEKSSLAEPIGEAWLSGLLCPFANGAFRGRELGQAWPHMDLAWRGSSAAGSADFPLLVKFLFPCEKLSVQVHPDDDYAARHECAAGGRGKTEMWYALRANPSAEVLVGLKAEITREEFRRAIRDGDAEHCLERIPLRAGEAVFVPARTAHTIGAGLVLCEIQEQSDLTYRVYDYNRRDSQGKARELHIDKALAVMHFGPQSGGKLAPIRIARGAVTETYFISCPYFATEKWEFQERIATATSHEHFDLLIFLEGSGSIEASGERFDFAPGQLWMLPAAMGAYQLAPQSATSLLRTYLPADTNEFVRRLEDRGIGRAELSKLIYS
jgi:mannose-6-phosphate isomerase